MGFRVPTLRSSSAGSRLKGKRVAMVTFSSYPFDPRPRRAANALLKEGMTVDLICLGDEKEPKREVRERTQRRSSPYLASSRRSAFLRIQLFRLHSRLRVAFWPGAR